MEPPVFRRLVRKLHESAIRADFEQLGDGVEKRSKSHFDLICPQRRRFLRSRPEPFHKSSPGYGRCAPERVRTGIQEARRKNVMHAVLIGFRYKVPVVQDHRLKYSVPRKSHKLGGPIVLAGYL